ncbi:ribonuclease E/G [Sutterella megalosphaeroides]|uniref:Ribonuclease E n=1 Tax=Sutterella megalosphaeroides TaxID=2494234 RepID=A0A2Z6IAY7_9BURK|nr:ribonuclease E/G [Sutterella megalosphaeroides]BBF22757.1 hypothetical protein SUTMEG_06480 [Sutterella megalosphaeroides]
MKRMLFNATHAEETRVGIVDGQKLIDIDIETAGREARKSNIYKGIVTRIEPSLEACFVNYGEERHGFLPFKEISRSYFKEGVDVRTATIREAITEGQELIVQVEKEERGNKGAALTTFISLAGRYLVLMPNNPRAGGVSRRIEGEERQELREAMEKLDLPHGMSTIARTAGIGRTTEELQWDLNYLLKLWEAIADAAAPQYELVTEENGRRKTVATTEPVANGKPLKRLNPPPFLIVEESNLVVRAIRDYFQPEIGEILVDTDEIYEQARQFMAHVMPDMVNRVKRYREDIPLFTRFQIEQQIETAYSRTVPLPSGGAIVIDHTEALVAIDVNSARATRGADIEETAFRTNCEAADEVARQMRLRDLGGLIVIDFIDMADSKNQRAVEQRLKDAIRYDRARVQLAKISRFGLMELSRQRLRPSLSEGNHVTCPRCNGVGVIRDTESCALQVLRILQEEAMKEGTGAVHAQVPVDVATFLLNEKRNDITKLEARHRVPIVLIPNTYLETPHYHIERLRQDDERLDDAKPSFDRAEEIETVADDPYAQKGQEDKPARPKQVPVIKNVLPRDPAPVHVEKKPEGNAEKGAKDAGRAAQLTPVTPKKGLFARIAAFLFGSRDESAEAAPKAEAAKAEGQAKDEKSEKNERDERRGRRSRRTNERRSNTGRRERTERTDRLERAEKLKGEKAEKAEKAEKGSDRTERTDRTDRTDRNDRPRRSRRRTTEEAVNEAPVVETTEAVEVAAAPVQSAQPAAPAAEGDEAQKPRRSRRRRRSSAEGEVAQATDEVKSETAATDREEGEKAEKVEQAEKPAVAAEIPAEVRETTEVVEAEAAEADKTDKAESGDKAPEADEGEGRSRRRRRPRRRTRAAAEEGAEEGVKAEDAKSDAEAAVEAQSETKTEAKVEAKRSGELPVEGLLHPEIVVPAPHVPEVPVPHATTNFASELVQIETKKSAVTEAVEHALEEEAQPRPKRRRQAPRREEETLVQIETKKVDVAQTSPVVTEKAEAPAVAEAVETVVAVEQVETTETIEAAVPAVEVVEVAEVTEVVEAPKAVKPAKVDDVAEGLEANLARAGLVQVHTNPEHVTFKGYDVVRQPGRAVEKRADEASEGPLEQVHTRPELCRPVVYEAVRYPGRPKATVVVTEEGPLVQVHTTKKD